MATREGFAQDLRQQLAGLSGRELARRAGFSPTLVNDVIAGRKVPTEDQLRDMLQAAEVDHAALLVWLARRSALVEAERDEQPSTSTASTSTTPPPQAPASPRRGRRRAVVTAGLVAGGLGIGFAAGFLLGRVSADDATAGPVGTPARVDHTADLGVTLYADPNRAGGGTGALAQGERIVVVCQVGDGEPITDRVDGKVITWPVWDRLDTGDYLPDIYTSLPKDYDPGPDSTALMTC